MPRSQPESDDQRCPLPRVWTEVTLRDLPTADLLDVVVRTGYQGSPWYELQRRLIDRALPDLRTAIQSGCIFQLSSKAGYGIRPVPALQRDPFPEEIAAETVEECLLRFKTKILPSGEWDPGRGVTLEDFFAVCCLSDLANTWRRYVRHLPTSEVSLDDLLDSDNPRLQVVVADASADPAEIVTLRDLIAQTLAPLNSEDRRSFILLEAGWSRAEIAQELGIRPNTLDARLSRSRKLIERRSTS